MGVYTSIYTGPYVECKTHLVDGVEEHFSCQNRGCRKFNRVITYSIPKFCPDCGAEIESVKVPIKEKAVDWQDLDLLGENLTNAFYSDEALEKLTDIFVLNINLFERETTTDINDSLLEVTPELIKQECVHFLGKLGADLDELRKHYDSVVVKWGVIVYNS